MNLKPLILAGALALTTAAEARDVTDMTGRVVTLPDEINSVITIGAVPVLNSFIFATGRADAIANDLPPWARNGGRHTWQYVFAPNLADNPQVEDAERTIGLETILTIGPDLAISFGQDVADLLEANGIPTVIPRVQNAEDVKATVALMGEVFGNETVGAEYAAWFDAAMADLKERLQGVETRPSVLYLNPLAMTQPHKVAEWWITQGGGDSVTNDGTDIEVRPLSTEFVLAADPDVLIVYTQDHITALKEDPNLSTLRAVQEGRMLAAPVGAHTWANRTAEQPLTVLWTASQLHPDLYPEEELVAKVREFYQTFYSIDLTDEDVRHILASKSRVEN
ncbi:MAG: ABC transporter substrate-binding protein [Tropicimonas sp.]|uniref:ABC transporter substrate-binding protein n=1 Tax=Tropicimonas sp. TaxID=2067044 RepID=UPI003A8B43D9